MQENEITNDSKVGGILSIISGAFGVLWLGWMVLMILMLRSMTEGAFYGGAMPFEMFNIMATVYIFMGVVLTLTGVLGIVGGVFALKRKYWGLALAGAIAGAITFFPCGIAAIIFVVKSQREFLQYLSPVFTGKIEVQYDDGRPRSILKRFFPVDELHGLNPIPDMVQSKMIRNIFQSIRNQSEIG